ncbi:hypothetical protein GCM10011583_48180 [Streptomyces camponoticapitis]|uniref:HTH arsR-type domain-containing protein n=2 Tax=Streptomyces camponoticapitis TaxID=1616125 RepID=A0ABQ2EFS2_9ACTN|nr:hypothetical protein GCM10011583_48180 [Streptomyces camponoticapitis]
MTRSWGRSGDHLDVKTRTAGETKAATVALFHLLGDTTRLAILQRLTFGEGTVVDLVKALGLPSATTSAHLSYLMDCGLVDRRIAEHGHAYYITHQPELLDLLNNAGHLLAAVGADTACGHIHGTVEGNAS